MANLLSSKLSISTTKPSLFNTDSNHRPLLFPFCEYSSLTTPILPFTSSSSSNLKTRQPTYCSKPKTHRSNQNFSEFCFIFLVLISFQCLVHGIFSFLRLYPKHVIAVIDFLYTMLEISKIWRFRSGFFIPTKTKDKVEHLLIWGLLDSCL